MMSNASIEEIYNYLRLSDRIGTSGQPQIEQFAAIKAAGFEFVVNLLPDPQVLDQEPEVVHALGMEYLQIPVWWEEPAYRDLLRFFEMMEADPQKQTFIHCAANMRVSAFIYLHRVLRERRPVEEAQVDLQQIWSPNPIWQKFMDKAISRYEAGDEDRVQNVPG